MSVHREKHKNAHKIAGADAFGSSDVLDAVVKRLQESGGPTTLLVGAVADGQALVRSGTGIVGSDFYKILSEGMFYSFGMVQATGWNDSNCIAMNGRWRGTLSANVYGSSGTSDGLAGFLETNALTGARAGFDSSALCHRRQWTAKAAYRFALSASAAIRLFVGFTTETFDNSINADNPAGASMAGIQFSTPRADVNWKFMTQNAGAQSLYDSGVAPGAAPVLITIELNPTAGGGNVIFALYDANGLLVASSVQSVNIPPEASDLRFIAAVETQESVAKRILTFHGYTVDKK